MRVYEVLASLLAGIDHCRASGDKVWEKTHIADLVHAANQNLPTLDGFEGSVFLYATSTVDELVYIVGYHDVRYDVSVVASLNGGIKVTAKPITLDEDDKLRGDESAYVAEIMTSLLKRDCTK